MIGDNILIAGLAQNPFPFLRIGGQVFASGRLEGFVRTVAQGDVSFGLQHVQQGLGRLVLIEIGKGSRRRDTDIERKLLVRVRSFGWGFLDNPRQQIRIISSSSLRACASKATVTRKLPEYSI